MNNLNDEEIIIYDTLEVNIPKLKNKNYTVLKIIVYTCFIFIFISVFILLLFYDSGYIYSDLGKKNTDSVSHERLEDFAYYRSRFIYQNYNENNPSQLESFYDFDGNVSFSIYDKGDNIVFSTYKGVKTPYTYPFYFSNNPQNSIGKIDIFINEIFTNPTLIHIRDASILINSIKLPLISILLFCFFVYITLFIYVYIIKFNHKTPKIKIPIDLLLLFCTLFIEIIFMMPNYILKIISTLFVLTFFVPNIYWQFRAKCILKSTFTYWIIQRLIQIIHIIHILKTTPNMRNMFIKIIKSLMIIAVILILPFFFFPLLLLYLVASIPILIYITIMLNRIINGINNINNLNFNTTINTKYMFGKLKKQIENLNTASIKINEIIEDKIKSERFKTELITNVSHDIKTPLTSIINYTDLISKENTSNENIKKYSAILLNQSNKLKKLTEDLIEASKASTGDLDITLSPCNVSVLLNQITGEYSDKFGEKSLEFVVHIKDNNTSISIDNKHFWRVLDNVINNIYNYSQENTRVYIDAELNNDIVSIIFRNTSKYPLNISAEKLMQRFTRGDEARTTGGNGLGISIAKSLMELQNGNLDISIEADLFKLTLSIPIIK